MKNFVLPLSVAIACSGPAFAEDVSCTAEDMQNKGLEAATAMQTLAASDPALMQEIAMDLQDLQAQAAQASDGDYDALCATYDEIIAKVK